ncbi:MAG: hypothetical protein PVJ27_06865 [Candidatus Brocadiaceae bacterium]|jgi:hypothetical protein
MLKIETEGREPRFEPLDAVTVRGAEGGTIRVLDGDGCEYIRGEATDPFTFGASGAVGTHTVLTEDEDGRLSDKATFSVDCATCIRESRGLFGDLLQMLYWTMIGRRGEVSAFRHGGRIYKYFVGWLRDHVHTLKGMKYYYPDLKSGIELYADTQREDGMVFDKVDKDHSRRPTHRDHWFGPGGFIREAADGSRRMERIPVENDVEYLFVEGLYYTWKATGDDEWMEGLLDNAIRAFDYSTSDPYRWSEKYGLLKRGFTIDTWDFQAEEDSRITGYTMVVDKDKSRFGVMHGDNTGFMAGCRYLAEMLEKVGRSEEAGHYRRLADTIKERLDEVSWNGEFYTHHVPEDPDVERDLGVDQSKQVSLSNAYALNRGIDHDQCVAIIQTYQRIREEMPDSSPGEFYQIYPPFGRWRDQDTMWHYMNGGVTTIVAGELAHGAFEHGFEDYGVDILERVSELGRKHDDYLHCTYRGKMPEPPERSFEPLDIADQANIDLKCPSPGSVTGWSGEPGNDLAQMPTGRQVFHEIPFDVVDPAENERRAAIGISCREGYHDDCAVDIGRKAASIYFLHTAGGENPIGSFEVHYADGSSRTEYVMKGQNVNGWWLPKAPSAGRHREPVCRVAWWGPNDVFPNVGTYVYGFDNPCPEKTVEKLVLRASANGSFWAVLGLTLCDAPVFFMPTDLSYGIPDNWGAAAVVYALVEGLAGIKDTGAALDHALLAPRWAAAGVEEARATVKYRASEGYVSYHYAADEEEGAARFTVASSADRIEFRYLLPKGKEAEGASVDGQEAGFTVEKVESSRYVCLPLEGRGLHTVRLALA